MPESLCTRTHLCMKQPDCPDSHCQGRWEQPQPHLREGGLRQQEGPHTIHFRPLPEAKPKRWSFLQFLRDSF